MSFKSFGSRYTVMLSKTFDGSGRERGILVKMSNVTDVF